MIRALPLALLLAAPAPAAAQDLGCPTDLHAQLYTLTEGARSGAVTAETLGEKTGTLVRICGTKRVTLSQILAAFTYAGLAIEPPDRVRFSAHLHALRTSSSLTRGGAGDFAPVEVGAGVSWSVQDERDAYWDLMFAMASDFLVFGVHKNIYTAGRTEQVGCGLYPAEEASGLARLAEGNGDGGELVARVYYLASQCDDDERGTSGYAAAYFAAHFDARVADDDYVGLTSGDIRAGLTRFLDTHLDGEAESWLFAADAVTTYRSE